ncbi:MAG: hypothetical protein MR562_01965, partial [Clostridiaceae bacterium]|nr:hypothetical protein [Clostridiaceae bacterium]
VVVPEPPEPPHPASNDAAMVIAAITLTTFFIFFNEIFTFSLLSRQQKRCCFISFAFLFAKNELLSVDW